jgi:hypothetical protein
MSKLITTNYQQESLKNINNTIFKNTINSSINNSVDLEYQEQSFVLINLGGTMSYLIY